MKTAYLEHKKTIFEIEVHFRYFRGGQSEKDFEVHKVESDSSENAIIEVKKLYPSLSKIPFAFYVGGEKV